MLIRRSTGVLVVATVCFLTSRPEARPAAHFQTSDYGQISMQNNTAQTLDLYVDDKYGCRALKNLFCTVQAHAGKRVLVAKGAKGFERKQDVELKRGTVHTWKVK